MKTKSLFITIFIFILCLTTLSACKKEDNKEVDKNEITYSFVSPTKTEYYVGESLDLTGSKIIVKENGKEDTYVSVTTNMLDQTTVPSFDEVGVFVVKVKYESMTFQFNVTISTKPVTIVKYQVTYNTEISTAPSNLKDVTNLPNTLPVLTFEGYIFKGWYLDSNYEVVATPGMALSSDVTLYAKWEEEILEVVLTGIEVTLKDENKQYVRTLDPSSLLKVREVYSDKSVSEWMDVSSKNITGYTINNGFIEVLVSVTIKNKTYSNKINLALNEEVLSVSNLLKQEVGNTYTVTGVVIAMTSIITRNEMILQDKETGEIISLGDIGEGKLYNGYYDSFGIEIGDEIIVPVELVKNVTDAESGNSGKVYASFIGGKYCDMAIISRNNEFSYNLEAIVVDSQEDLINLVNSASRETNLYQKVLFRGEMNFIHYASSDLFRFWFEDGNIDNYNNQMIEGISPVFSSGQLWYSTGKNFQTLAFGDRTVTSVDWDNPVNRVLEIEAIFIGGNGYYYQFVILEEEDIKEVEVKLENVTVISPKKTTYSLNTSLDLSGAELVFEYDIRSDITYKLTLDMIDEASIPDFTKAGTYTIKGSHLGQEFFFDIEIIEAVISSIEIVKNPNKVVYNHRATYEDVELNGGQIRVNYSDGSSDIIDMTQDMAPAEESSNWQIGEVTYEINYLGHKASLTVTFENTAISVSEFLKGTIGEVYEVTGVVVGPTSTHSTSDLLLIDKNTLQTVSINNTGIVGKYNALDLDEEYLNVGDEIIVTIKLRQLTTANSGSTNKICGNSTGGNKDSFVKTIIKLSENNQVNWDFDSFNVVTISTQNDLVEFLNSETRFNAYVKFVGLKGYWQNSGYRIFLDSNISSTTEQKVNGVSPFLYSINTNVYLTNGIQSYFTNASSQKYSSPATTTYEIYALFLGGSTYYHDFTILDDSWMVDPSTL